MTVPNSPKVPKKQKPPLRRFSGEVDDGRKDHPCSGGFLSNDGFLWTDTNPDLKLIEPRILVSVNHNYLEFSRKPTRPPERCSLTLTNHGDHPIAFQVMTTDNYSYFVDRKHGIIPPRQCSVNAIVRVPNAAIIHVFRRPHEEYASDSDKAQFYNVPHKDKMQILLAPQMCQTFSPEAIFHNERCYEKLRIMLRYTGIEMKEGKGTKEMLLHVAPGWKTWQEDTGEQKKETHALQIAEFKKQETKLIHNVSREQIDEQQLKKPKTNVYKKYNFTPKQKTPKTAASNEAARKEQGAFKKFFKNLNPFAKEENGAPGLPAKSPAKVKNEETPKKLAPPTSQGSVEVPKKSADTAVPPPSKRLENNEQVTPKQAKKSAEDKKDKDTPTPDFLRKSREARKLAEQKDKKDVATPPALKKSTEKDRKDVATPPQAKKSIEKEEKKVGSPEVQLEKEKEKEKVQEIPSPSAPVSPASPLVLEEPKEHKEHPLDVTQSPRKKSTRGTSPTKTKED